MTLAYFANKYKGRCKCGAHVYPNEGICFRPFNGAPYSVACRNCYPLESAKVYADRDSAKAVEAKKLMDLETRRQDLIAYRNALIARLGLCMDSPFDMTTKQLSYSDHTEWKVPFNGEGTDMEFKHVLESTPSKITTGLRSSAGVKITAINREEGYVALSETIHLCD